MLVNPTKKEGKGWGRRLLKRRGVEDEDKDNGSVVAASLDGFSTATKLASIPTSGGGDG